MTDTDGYNGWTNRETWAASLHLSNDQGLYNLTNELAHQARDEAQENPSEVVTLEQQTRYLLANSLRSLFDEWAADVIDGDYTTRDLRMMLFDIGSLHRVEWGEVAGNWLEGLEQ